MRAGHYQAWDVLRHVRCAEPPLRRAASGRSSWEPAMWRKVLCRRCYGWITKVIEQARSKGP